MKTLILRSQFNLPSHTNFTTPTSNMPFLILSQLKLSPNPSSSSSHFVTFKDAILPNEKIAKGTQSGRLLVTKSQEFLSRKESFEVDQNGQSKFLILGAVSLGFVLFLMGMDEQKAMALGPEGPLMEEFWDNMRRYALYVLTVSTGVAYTVFQPILELLRNPISAILILTIIGGSIYIVSQVLSAMVGVSDFTYDYSY